MNIVRGGRDSKPGQPHAEVAFKDMRPANPEQTAVNLSRFKRRGQPFAKGNRCGGRRLELTGLGLSQAGMPEVARKELRKAETYRQRRVRELTAVYGYVSAGASAMLGSAAIALASSKQVAGEAFRTGDTALHELAIRIAEKASQLELKAVFMARNDTAGGGGLDNDQRDLERRRSAIQRQQAEAQARQQPATEKGPTDATD